MNGYGMTETYTQEELGRAWSELDRISVDYHLDLLERICIQARKNRLWEAHVSNVSPLQDTASRFGFDLAEPDDLEQMP